MQTNLSPEEFTLAGSGGAVLLVHGLGGGPYELQLLGEYLHRKLGWTVRAIRLPGHRRAATWMPHSTWPEWVAGLGDDLEQLERDSGEEAVHLVAFSMGSLPSLSLAARGRLRGKLVLLAPFFGVYRPAGLNVEWGMKLTPYVPRRGPPLRDRAMREQVERCLPFRVFSVRAARSALDLAHQLRGQTSQVKGPVLVLQGDQDTVVDASASQRFAAQLGNRCEFQLFRGSDHLLALDGQREEVFAATAQFLQPLSRQHRCLPPPIGRSGLR